MLRTRNLSLSLLAGLAVLLVGALTPPTPRVTAPVPVYPVHPDAEAGRVLDAVVAAFDPDRLPWLRMNLWQEGNPAAFSYRAEGVYLAGPDHRLRLDLQVHAGGADRRLQVVSDGRTLWQIDQAGPTSRTVSHVRLQPVLDALNSPYLPADRRAEFYQRQLFTGPGPLLQSLRPGTTFTRCQEVRWAGRNVRLLTGVRAQPPAATWPEFLPRQCRLFVDAQTLWPHRLEWWGPVPDCEEDCLLLAVEFRDPIVGQRVPDEVFAFQPGKAKVTDQTRAWIDGVRTGFPEALMP